MGYFKEARLCPLYAAGLNVILSVILAKWIGLSGIFFATAISRFFTFNIVDPYHVFRKAFERSEWIYFKQFFIYFGILVLSFLLSNVCVRNINGTGWFVFVVKLIVNCLVCNLVFLICFFRTDVFRETIRRLLNILKKKRR